MDEIALADRGSVIFRFALGTDGSAESEGFAFDNFKISEREKNVLLEQFSSTNIDASKVVSEEIDSRLGEASTNNDDIIAINYHNSVAGERDKYDGSVNPPILTNPDPISIVNIQNPSARIAYYRIATVPSSILDGQFYLGENSATAKTATDILWTKNDVARSSLLDADFDIVISNDFGSLPEVLEINVVATTKTVILGGASVELALHIAIIEKDVDISSGAFDRNGQQISYNALRKMLPNGVGSRFKQSYPQGTILNVTETWDISKDLDA